MHVFLRPSFQTFGILQARFQESASDLCRLTKRLHLRSPDTGTLWIMGYRNKFRKVLFHERISSFLIFLYDFKVLRESWTSHRKENLSAVRSRPSIWWGLKYCSSRMYPEVCVRAEVCVFTCDVFLIPYIILSFNNTIVSDTSPSISSQMHRNLFAYYCESSITSAVYHSDLSISLASISESIIKDSFKESPK